MDMGNELRAALNRQGTAVPMPPVPPPQKQQQQQQQQQQQVQFRYKQQYKEEWTDGVYEAEYPP